MQAELYGIKHRVSRSPQQFNLGRGFFAKGLCFLPIFHLGFRKKGLSATTSNALVPQSFVFRLGLCHVILVLSFCYSRIWLFLLLSYPHCAWPGILSIQHHQPNSLDTKTPSVYNTFFLMALWTTWFMVFWLSFTLEK